MAGSIVLGLIQNIAILLSFSLLYDFFWAKEEHSKLWLEKIIAGLIVGGIGVVLMFSPWTLVHGIIFDSRTILLSVAGLFLGFIPTVVAIVITATCRIVIGGGGVWMGVATIVTSGCIGLLWGKFRPLWRNGKYVLELLSMGVLVHAVMLACTMLLPKSHMDLTLKALFFPVVFIYCPGTMLFGLLMLKRAENWRNKKKLRETKALYVSLVENMPAGVFRKDLDGRYEYVNSRFCGLKGLTVEEILGKNPRELAEYEKVKELAGLYVRKPHQRTLVNLGMEHHEFIVTNGQSLEVEEVYEQEDGSYEYFQVVKTPVFDLDGRVIGSQGMTFDITLQKKMQLELNNAKEKAEDSDRLKTSFLHNISHEIRTPMNAIVGFSSFLNEEDLSDEKRRYYTEVIIQSSNQLLSIIDDIVRIATIEAGQETVNGIDFHLNSLCLLAYSQFKDVADKSGVSFQMNTPLSETEDLLFSDETKVFEVLSNLLDNALKFTKEGCVNFGYVVKGDVLEFFVEDTGIGISKEFHEEIFKRFRQADSNLCRHFGGSGLGLSICKSYIELLGGHIWVRSQPEMGATFYFTLPFKRILNV